jgi:hypothetical protein
MEYFRVLHARHFDSRRREFKSLAFRNSSDGTGVSVIQRECIDQHGHSWCEHIRVHYRTVASDPPIFWCLKCSVLPHGHRLVNDDSDGDECHYVIDGVSDAELKNLLKSVDLHQLLICRNGIHENLTDDDIARLNTVSQAVK